MWPLLIGGSEVEWNWDFGANSNPPNASNVHPVSVWFPSQDNMEIVLESSAYFDFHVLRKHNGLCRRGH